MAETTKKELVSKKYKKRSALGEVWHHMSQNKGAMIGLAFLVFLAFCAFGSELFLDYETDVIGRNIKEQFQGPSAAHWFGTDQMGRDIPPSVEPEEQRPAEVSVAERFRPRHGPPVQGSSHLQSADG